MTLRSKLLSIILIATLGSILIAGLISTVIQHSESEKTLVNSSLTLNQIIGDRSSASLVFGDDTQAEKNLKALAYQPYFVIGCIYNASGELFASHSVDEAISCKRQYSQQLAISSVGTLNTASDIESSGEVVGFIITTFSKDAVTDQVRSFLVWEIWLLLFLMLLVGGVSIIVLRKALFPLKDLTDTVSKIKATKVFEEQQVEKRSNDEVGQLVDRFNAMFAAIRTENKKLISSESRFRNLTGNSPVGVFERDLNGNYIYVNQKWREITQIAASPKMISVIFNEQIDKKDIGSFLQAQINIVQGETSAYSEYKVLPLNSHLSISVIEYLSPLTNADGELTGVIGTLVDVSELREAQNQLEELAFYDPLTKLPNRRFFADEVINHLSDKPDLKCAILFIDLDNFKNVNDSLGHDAGDEVLVIIAKKLLKNFSNRLLVSRMGGDEFNLFVPEIQSVDEVRQLCQDIREAICEPIVLQDNVFQLFSSIGVSIYPEDGDSLSSLLKSADIALYEAKERGRNQFHFFSEDLNKKLLSILDMEAQLKEAIANNSFEVFLQPQIDLKTMQCFGAEALLRWRKEDGSYLSPFHFIPIAEKTGHIFKIDDFVLRETIRLIRENYILWKECGVKSIAINLSAKKIYNSDLVAEVVALLDEFQIEASFIEVELTESMVIEDIEKAIDAMNRLRNIGVSLAIDDFGTGYSSLNYLKRFPIDKLKIDKSFVMDIPQDVHDMEISSAIIAMGQKLGLNILAEGLESEEQLKFLKENGCDFAQGYLFSRPVPISEFNQCIKDWRKAQKAKQGKLIG